MPGLDTAPEVEVTLMCGGSHVTTWFCSPAELEELAVGWLVGEGVAADLAEIADLSLVDPTTVHATLRSGSPDDRPRSSPLVADHAERPTSAVASWLGDGSALPSLFSEMFDESPSRRGSGGVHTGALVLGGQIRHVSEDVSRHCLVDKLIGRALRKGFAMTSTTILLSARISGAIAAKACRSGIGVVASMSIPTDPAADLAGRCGLILVGRSRRPEPQVHRPRG